jgi:hypothetical protein
LNEQDKNFYFTASQIAPRNLNENELLICSNPFTGKAFKRRQKNDRSKNGTNSHWVNAAGPTLNQIINDLTSLIKL